MSNMYNDVKEFHEKFDQRIGSFPAFAPNDVRDLRIRLLKEEYEEYLEAEATNDFVEVADALADIIYIVLGTAVSYGIDLNEVWDEVQRSNMDKLHDGKVVKNELGKILKPAGWTPPNVQGVLNRQTTNFLEGLRVNNGEV